MVPKGPVLVCSGSSDLYLQDGWDGGNCRTDSLLDLLQIPTVQVMEKVFRPLQDAPARLPLSCLGMTSGAASYMIRDGVEAKADRKPT